MEGYLVFINGPNVVPGSGTTISPVEGTYVMRITYTVQRKLKKSELDSLSVKESSRINNWDVYYIRPYAGKNRAYFVKKKSQRCDNINNIVYEYERKYHQD